MEDQIKCPKCGSTQITAGKKGFNPLKAAGGALLTGGIGLLAGFHGSKKVFLGCMKCGHTWSPKNENSIFSSSYKPKQTIAHTDPVAAKGYQTASNDLAEWKQSFYNAYKSGNYDHAGTVYYRKSSFSGDVKDVHDAYKKMKREDRAETLVKCFVALVIILVLIGIIYIASY